MSTQEEPKWNIKITPFEFIFNGVTITLFLGSIFYLVFIWNTLPTEIPAHYNALGEVDRWGSKWEMMILPIISVLLWVGITVSEKYLHVYYRKQSKENVHREYLNVRSILNTTKNIAILAFVYLEWQSVQIALSNESSLSTWFSPFLWIFLFGPIIYITIRAMRTNDSLYCRKNRNC